MGRWQGVSSEDCRGDSGLPGLEEQGKNQGHPVVPPGSGALPGSEEQRKNQGHLVVLPGSSALLGKKEREKNQGHLMVLPGSVRVGSRRRLGLVKEGGDPKWRGMRGCL
ncbi:hypothetical protein Dimus_028417 [Dionaea muscipula]